MEIRWFGQGCFLITTNGEKKEPIKILIDPAEKEQSKNAFRGDINLAIMNHLPHASVSLKEFKDDFCLIDSPGEYDVKNIFIRGLEEYNCLDKKEKSFIVLIESENIKICHLGKFCLKEIPPSMLEEIGDVDVLMVPIGGKEVVEAREAQKIINQIEPRIVIPAYYPENQDPKTTGLQFLIKSFGQSEGEIESKILIRKEKLPLQTIVAALKKS